MNLSPIFKAFCWLLLLGPAAAAQTAPTQPVAPPVSYTSMSQLNLLLGQLEQASQSSQADLAKLRIEKWKTDGSVKRQEQSNVESLQRNLQTALPGIIAELRLSPENLTSTFKLYRNLDALYDVFGSLVESAGAFGSKDDFQSLQNDLGALERARRAFADRMDTLAGAKEVELTRLRSEIRTAQTVSAPPPPRKVLVDDTVPPKKPAKKKSASKTAASSTSASQPPAASQPH